MIIMSDTTANNTIGATTASMNSPGKSGKIINCLPAPSSIAAMPIADASVLSTRMAPQIRIELSVFPQSSSRSVKGVQRSGSRVFCSRSPTRALAEIIVAGMIENIASIAAAIGMRTAVISSNSGPVRTREGPATSAMVRKGPKAALSTKLHFTILSSRAILMSARATTIDLLRATSCHLP
jgi:hypothetical protein